MRAGASIALLFLAALVAYAPFACAQEAAGGKGDFAAPSGPAFGAEKGPALQAPTSYIGSTRPQWSVFVIGDLLAEGIWGGLSRMSEGNDRLDLNLRMKEESGLARPGVYDWPAAVEKIADANTMDVAVVMLGSNDGQDMQSDAGTIAFGTPEWRKAYAAEVDRLISTLQGRSVSIYWLGVPPSGDPARDAALKIVNDIQKERAAAGDVKFVDLRKLFTTPDDQYADTFPDEQGNAVRMRMRDGLRMLKAGNTRAALAILPVITADIDEADKQVEAPSAAVEATPEPGAPQASTEPPQSSSGPSFGGGGETEDWRGGTKPPEPAVPAIARGDRLDERQVESKRIVTDFTERSILPPPKKGRIDDFSYSPPAAN